VAKVLITGAAGLIGSVLRESLGEAHTLAGIDRRRVSVRGIRRADVRRLRSIESSFAGVDAVVDLATGSDTDLAWSEVWGDSAARVNVLEAARRHGVTRYVFASSNHVTGLYERDHPYAEIVAGAYDGLDPAATPLIGSQTPLRPDGPYAVGKAAAEAAARYYADAFGLSCVCLRIGTVNREDRPLRPRHFATLLTHADLTRLVECAIRAPLEHRFGIYYGVSQNTWRFWDVDEARAGIGFVPQDNAERFRSEEPVERP
jgi:nucleoside-diphosphate-sugar epimerase